MRFDRRNRVRAEGSSGDAVADAIALAEQRKRVEESRLDMMREYAGTSSCRRQFLLSYFGEELPAPCGYCDTCDSGKAMKREPGDSPYRLDERVRHQEFGDGAVLRFEGDRIVVRFDEVGYRTLSLEAIAANGLLERVP